MTPESTVAANEKLIAAIDKYYANTSQIKSSHCAVPIELALSEEVPDVSLFLATTDSKNHPAYKIFREEGLYLSTVEVQALIDNGVKNVYILRSDVPKFTQYVERVLVEMPTTSPMVDQKKVTLLRDSAIGVMTEIFASPTPEAIEKGVKVVNGFVYLLMKDPKAYDILLSLSSHDHYTLQHSVGVATNAIILGKKVGVNDEAALIELGIGGLLHDIGKTKVPTEIINKKGPLDESEWAVMKQHSLFGYEILKDNPNVGMRAKLAVLQHHEETNGTGYPVGLSGPQIDLFAKVTTIADIYNALTTDRSYSTARSPFDAFKLIRDKLSHKIDAELFDSMVKIYGGKAP